MSLWFGEQSHNSGPGITATLSEPQTVLCQHHWQVLLSVSAQQLRDLPRSATEGESCRGSSKVSRIACLCKVATSVSSRPPLPLATDRNSLPFPGMRPYEGC